MFKKIQEFRILKSILNLSKDPEQTENVFTIGDAMLNVSTDQETKDYLRIAFAYPGFRELYETNYQPYFEIKGLSKLEKNTLGYHYYLFMQKNKFVYNWYPNKKGSDPLTYLRNRTYQVHDILHTLTGFDRTEIGELGLQAFYAGQMSESPFPFAITSSAFIRAMKQPKDFRERLIEVIYQGYKMGKQSKPILFRKFEEDLDKDISNLRQEIGIQI